MWFEEIPLKHFWSKIVFFVTWETSEVITKSCFLSELSRDDTHVWFVNNYVYQTETEVKYEMTVFHIFSSYIYVYQV